MKNTQRTKIDDNAIGNHKFWQRIQNTSEKIITDNHNHVLPYEQLCVTI